MKFIRDLIEFELTDEQARTGVAIAAAFNLTGFLLLITTHTPRGPLLPPLLSMSIGLTILGILGFGRDILNRKAVFALYVLNTLSVVTALVILNSFYAGHVDHWIPFRPSQLGCLFTAMVAPSFLLGLFGIGVHVSASVAQYLTFSPEIHARLPAGEPTPILAFGLAGLLILIMRYRHLVLLQDFHITRTEAATSKALAINCLFIRDLMNTPLQTLVASVELLEQAERTPDTPIVQCRRAIEQLDHLNSLLKRHESHPTLTTDSPLTFSPPMDGPSSKVSRKIYRNGRNQNDR